MLTNHLPASDVLTFFIAQKLTEQAVGLIGAPGLLGADRDIAMLLRKYPIILPVAGTSIRTGFDAMADHLGVRPQIAAEVDDIAMMRLRVREGFALGVLPPIAVQDELASGALVEADELPGITETFFAVTTARRFPNPLAQALVRSFNEPG